MDQSLTNQQIAKVMRLIARQAELAMDMNNFAALLNLEATRREANVITTYVSDKVHGGIRLEPRGGTITELPVGTHPKDVAPASNFQRDAIDRLRRAPNGTIDDQLWVIGNGPKIAALIECAYEKVKP